MNFHIVSYSSDSSMSGNRSCLLVRNNWDDYSYKTTFGLFYIDSAGKKHDLGDVKIMRARMGAGYTPIDDSFVELGEGYASLGQSQDYYEGLMQLPSDDRLNILQSLRDVVWYPELQMALAGDDAYQSSLLRSLGSASLKKFSNLLHDQFENTPFHFTYTFPASTAAMEFVVEPYSLPPSNVHVVIGRNGIGKTTFLRNLTAILEDPQIAEQGRGSFSFQHAVHDSADVKEFANVVTVAFSAFDEFPAPRSDAGGIRYSYVGLRDFSSNDDDVRRLKTAADLEEEFVTSTLICLQSSRIQRWSSTIKILLCDSLFARLGLLRIREIHESLWDDFAREIFKSASSGHKVVLLALTRLVQLVDERTLVLIDEPEAHLHPPLQGAFIRALSALLIERNGVAILATHSPVVLQEVPSNCVWIMSREAVVEVNRPTLETFAENLSVLTQEVFRYELTESGFYTLLNKAASESATPEAAIERFNHHLGSEGRSITRSLWRQKNLA
jgi:predicted ATPase